jgi:hypothetical protein
MSALPPQRMAPAVCVVGLFCLYSRSLLTCLPLPPQRMAPTHQQQMQAADLQSQVSFDTIVGLF